MKNHPHIPFLLLFTLVLIIGLPSNAQQADTLIFAKGRVITSLFGSLSNKITDINGAEENNITTSYTVGTKSGVFMADKWAMGVNFSLSRSDFATPTFVLESENLVIGYWNRYYFLALESAALHAEITPYYTAIHQQSQIMDPTGVPLSNRVLSGNGYGIAPGVGFTYILNRNVGFGINLVYSWTQIRANTEDVLIKSVTTDVYTDNQLEFGFNFQIYIDQFFF
jgi:hypothetical protein